MRESPEFPAGRGARGAAPILPAPVPLGRVMCTYCELAAEVHGGRTRQSGEKFDLSPDHRVRPP